MSDSLLNFTSGKISNVGKAVFLTFTALILMMLDNHYEAIEHAKSTVGSMMYPLRMAVSRPFVWLDDISELTQSHWILDRDNKQLRTENMLLRARLNEQVARIAELEEKARMENIRSAAADAVIARISGEGRLPSSDTLDIDRGTGAGIVSGSAVADNGGLVGQIINVSALGATVRLLNNPRIVVPVMSARTGERSLVYGQAGGPILPYFPIFSDLKSGDELVTSGSGGIYPPGIPVARVISADPNNASPYYRTIIQAISTPRASRFLLVFPVNRKETDERN